MTDVLRADPGSTGLVQANGGWLAKHAIATYSTRPPEPGFRYEDLRKQADQTPTREALIDFDGPVTVEAYTVAHRRGVPRIAHAACVTDDGRRTWSTTEEPAVMADMMQEEFCGRRGRIDGQGHLTID